MATIFGCSHHFATQKCLAAAEYSSTKLNVKDEQPPSDKMPYAGRPVLIEGKTSLLGSLPISWHVGSTLRGVNKEEEPNVLCWMNCAENLYRPAVMAWVLPATSCMPYEKNAFEAARADTEKLLKILDNLLASRTFLVGERITLADISLAFELLPAYENVFEPSYTACIGNVTRWFMTVMNQPPVKKIVGSIKVCECSAKFDSKKWEVNQAKLKTTAAAQSSSDSHGGKKDGKKAAEEPKKADKEAKPEKKEKAKKEKEVEPEEEMDLADEAMAAEAPAKDPFAEMPKGTFNMDEFKRCYSNEDTVTKAIPYFWQHFDAENYSIWLCEYRFPKELTLAFMSCNLIGGMMQRLDKMRKCAFGSMCLFGTDNNSTIGGLWFWRGHELAFPLTPDWCVDYESYTWKKLDPADEATKTLVKEYFTWEFESRPFNQGKIFK